MGIYANRNLYLIFANTLAGVVSVSIIIPALPVIAGEFSLSPAQVGLLITSYTLPGVLFGLFMGVLADKFGRKSMIVPSLVLFGFAGGGIYWVEDFAWLNVMRFLQGIGGAILPSMSTILIGDLFESEIRMKVLGINAAVLSVGTAVFPFVGGLMAGWGWNVPFLTFLFALPLAVLVALFLDEPERKQHSHILEYFKSAHRYILRPRGILVYSTAIIVFILLYGGLLTYLTLYMNRRFGMDSFAIGAYIASASLSTVIVAMTAHRLEEIMGRTAMAVSGFAGFAICFFTILLAPSEIWLLGSILVFGASMGIIVPMLQNVVTELSPTEYRGLLASLLGVLVRFGQTTGPMLMAVFYYFGGMTAVFAASGMIAVAFGLVLAATGHTLSRS